MNTFAARITSACTRCGTVTTTRRIPGTNARVCFPSWCVGYGLTGIASQDDPPLVAALRRTA